MSQGRRVTDAQVKELRRGFYQGASLRLAAMKAGMDRKTARKYRDRGQLPSESRAAHTWRTRVDPLIEVWPRLEELLQGEPALQAKTLVEWLQRECPGQDWQRRRRTVERRVRRWKAQHGPAKEVYFSQVHEPGRLGSSDFTHLDSLGVTIQGQPFPHLLYHFVLTSSNWEHVTLCFSESFASLSDGLQNALWELGGVPQRHRTDRMTLAVHHDGNLEQYTSRYQALMRHYGVTPEATNAYSGHENGDCEQSHRRFKEALAQELLLRGSRDFAGREEYWQFLRALVARRNASRGEKFAPEQARLGPLPERRLETLERQRVRVGQGSTVQVKKNIYSVPARLLGEWVEARIGAEAIEVWYAGLRVQTMERLRGQSKHRIDYRHVIDWLVRKPGAFARYVYREDLYPTVTYRRAYDALVAQQPERADREYVRILYLAAQTGESRVAEALAKLLGAGRPLSEQAVHTLLGSDTPLSLAAQVAVPVVDLRLYDALLEGASAGWCDHGISQIDQNKEVTDEHGRDGGVDTLPAGAAFGGGAEPARGGGTTGDGRVVELPDLLAGTGAARVPAAAAQPDRAVAQGFTAAVGEELGGAGSQASAGEGGAAVARPSERGLSGSAGERAGLWGAGLGEDARLVRRCSGTGPCRPAGAVHEVQSAGAGTAEGQARPASEGTVPRTVALGGSPHRRPGVCAADSGGDGGAVHVAGGTLRTRQRAGDEQPGVFAVGADLQGSDDDGGGDRPTGASQCDRGDERAELPGRVGEADAWGVAAEGSVTGGERQPWWGPGSAPGAVAALRLPPLRRAPTTAGFASDVGGNLIVAHGER
jgi:Mu transposase-like protein